MKNDMVDLDAFEKIVAEEKMNGKFLHTEEKIFWAMFYTIPTFHNPTGSTLPPGEPLIIFSLIDRTINNL